MNIQIALLSSLFIVSCASAMEKNETQRPKSSSLFRVVDDTSNDVTSTPQKQAVPQKWQLFRVLGDNHEEQTVGAMPTTPAQAALVTASWLRTRDTNEE